MLSPLTFVVLLLLVVIQFSFIRKAAKLEERNFNHRAMMALKDTRDEMERRAMKCSNMQNYLSGFKCAAQEKKKAANEVDSVLRSYLKLYRLDMNFELDILDTTQPDNMSHALPESCYLQNLNGILKSNGIRMSLSFPDRNQFVIEQMSGLFSMSILFIAFVMVSYILSQQIARRVQEKMQHMQEFINNMVHEFQTPLANMRFATNLLKKRLPSTADTKPHEYAEIVLIENKKMEKHVDEILLLACSPTATSETQLHLHQCITEQIKRAQFTLQQSNATVELQLQATNDSILADEQECMRVLSNLIDNALKYSKEEPKLTIRTKQATKNIELQIEDNGIGIAKKELPYIFDQYYRVSTGDIHNVKGFGLGLTYVKKIVKKYNGSISVNSTLSKGTCFTISLPVTH